MVLDYPITSDLSTILWNNKKITATHGHIYNEEKLPPLSPKNIFIYGHTHLPVAKKEKEIFILNPGSISLPKGGNPNSYGIFKDNSFKIMSFEGEVLKEISFD